MLFDLMLYLVWKVWDLLLCLRSCTSPLKNSFVLQFFTISRTHFSIIRSVLQNSSHSEHNISLCALNCGSFIIASALNAFIDDIWQITWILLSLRHKHQQNFMYYTSRYVYMQFSKLLHFRSKTEICNISTVISYRKSFWM